MRTSFKYGPNGGGAGAKIVILLQRDQSGDFQGGGARNGLIHMACGLLDGGWNCIMSQAFAFLDINLIQRYPDKM